MNLTSSSIAVDKCKDHPICQCAYIKQSKTVPFIRGITLSFGWNKLDIYPVDVMLHYLVL